MESKSFPGRLQRNRCKCLSLPAAELSPQQPASPAPPRWDALAHWTKLEEKQKRALRENRSWIFLPKPPGHVPYRQDGCRHRQPQCRQQVLAAVAHAEASGEAFPNLTLTEALWKCRGHPRGTAWSIKAPLPDTSAGPDRQHLHIFST